MNNKIISIISLAVAILSASVAAIVISINGASESRAKAALAASEEAMATAKEKTAIRNAEAEASKKRTAEENRKAKEAEREAAAHAKEQAKIERQTAEENRKAKEAEATTAKSNAEAARAKKDAEQAKLQTAREEKAKADKIAEAEALKAQAEADKLAKEKLKSEKVIAEATLLQLRQTDYETMVRELMEWKQELEERERALKPEKTIADLSWAGGTEDTIIDEKGNVKKQVKVKYDAEKDMSLPSTSRRLAKAERLYGESFDQHAEATKTNVINAIERLYVKALKENDVINAAHYKAAIKSMYPEWKFKGEERPEVKQ